MNTSYETGKEGDKTPVFIVDDHPLVREWLSHLINEEEDMYISGWADNVKDAITGIEHLKPGFIIVDIGLRGKSGLELIRFLTDQNPDELILVLSMHDESVYASRAYKAGARGYVSKSEATGKVVLAIRKILSGGLYVNEAMAESFARGLTRSKNPSLTDGVDLLSDRELEVFRLLAKGHETTDIAKDLSVSLKTVQSYCARIKDKMNLKNATELLQAATRWADAQNGSSTF